MKNINLFKVGDKVACLPGFNTNEAKDDFIGGGSGYKSGRMFVVGKVTDSGTIVWPVNEHQGVYVHALCYSDEHCLEQECNKIREEISGTKSLDSFILENL